MLHMAYRFVAAALLLFCSLDAYSQTQPPRHLPSPKVLGPANWNPSPKEVTAAYWTLEPGWSTELEMRNNLLHRELTITPVLRMGAGKEIALPPVTVAPQHIVSIDLRSSGQLDPGILDRSDSFGSVAFRFDGLSPANLFAATIVRREGHPISFHFDADDMAPNYPSDGIEGMWWLPAPTSTDYLILSNPSKKTVKGSLMLSSPTASSRPLGLSIQPGETKRIDLWEVLGTLGNGVMGGLRLSLPGKESLSATQIVFDEIAGLTAMMKLFDREPDDKAANHVLIAPMMALSHPDPSLAFPEGTVLIPRIFLRNAASGAERVLMGINWRSGSKSGVLSLPSITMAPGEVRVFNLADYQKSGQVPADATWGTVSLAYTGKRADLVAVALSYDKENRYGLQTPFSDALSRLWAGGMWHVDSKHNTLITTGNGGSEPTTAEVTLFYNGGKDKYTMQKLLSPGEHLWLDVGHLVHDQVPDASSRTLPADVMTGSYELRDLDHPTAGLLYEGKLVIDKTYGHAAYGCGECCGFSGPKFFPLTYSGPPGANYSEVLNSTEQCGGYVDDLSGDAFNWNSTNTGVATLSTPTLHTVATGSANGNATLYLQADGPPRICPTRNFYPTQPVTV